jgi:hypothetical protein
MLSRRIRAKAPGRFCTESCRRRLPGTLEACWDVSQAYAFFAYSWSLSEAKDRTLKGCRGFLAPHPGCERSPHIHSRGTQKNAYPWLSSKHRSAVLFASDYFCDVWDATDEATARGTSLESSAGLKNRANNRRTAAAPAAGTNQIRSHM